MKYSPIRQIFSCDQGKQHCTYKNAHNKTLTAVVGLKETITGETICLEYKPIFYDLMDFPETVISIAVEPKTTADEKKLLSVLEQLKFEDPSFELKVVKLPCSSMVKEIFLLKAFEAGADLTPENVSKYSLEHPRCGTSFLLTLVLLSVLMFSVLGPMSLALRLVTRVLFIPVLAGIAYEYIRWTANHLDSNWVKALIRPNMAPQHLTTQEPSLDIIEVSIAAFNAMMDAEKDIVV